MIWNVEVIDGVQSQLLGIGIWVSVALVAWRARRLNHEPFHAVVGLSVFVGVAIVGARLGALSIGQIVIADFLDPNMPGMTSSGGAVAVCMLAVGLVYRGRLGRTLLDDLTPGMWFLLAVSRLGCVFQGCDFGRASSWGVVYPMPSAAWSAQLLNGQISGSATSSLATFPFSMLDGLAAVIALIIAWKPGKHPASSTLASALAYFIIRFGLEFGRDPITTEMWGVFTRPQALLGVVAFGCLVALRITRTSDDSLSN